MRAGLHNGQSGFGVGQAKAPGPTPAMRPEGQIWGGSGTFRLTYPTLAIKKSERTESFGTLAMAMEDNFRARSQAPPDHQSFSSKKEVFQPHLPVRLPCYDLAPITSFALGRSSRSRTSSTPGFHGLTGGVYKARERIHRAMADARLLANPTSRSRVADSDPN